MNILLILIFMMSPVLLASCPLGFTTEEACQSENPSCVLFTDEDGDLLCDNPGPQPAASDSLPDDSVFIEASADSIIRTDESFSTDSSEYGVEVEYSHNSEETVEELTDYQTSIEDIQIEFTPDPVFIDTVTLEETLATDLACPLVYSPDQACPQNSPFCTFFIDADADLYCDNPITLPDSFLSASANLLGRTNGSELYLSGCPLGLTPETACPSPEDPLCPHYKGFSGCINPGGGGMSRTLILLIATAVLLPIATILKKHFYGRGKEDRHKRKIAHITVQTISLIVLGFLVQGCFCPLGVVQYALLPGGLLFLGGLGIAVLILPMLWSAFFDRVYCGWVCPFGAIQDLLGKLHVPRPPKFSHRVHSILSGFRYLLTIIFFGFILLVSSGQFESSVPTAFFCKFDPFHTIFSFFVVGSFVGAIAAMSILVFFPRFFCKYLCFYGAILSFLGRIGLWKRFTRKHPSGNNKQMKRE